MKNSYSNWGYIPILMVLATLGVVLVVAGITTANKEVSIFLNAVGGAIFGASFGGIFAGLSERKMSNSVLEILSNTSYSKISSVENDISPFRKKWYHYSVSAMNGNRYWRLVIYDFTKIKSIGKLNTTVSWSDKSDKRFFYDIEGIIRDQRVIFHIKAQKGSEPVAIEIMPFMGEFYQAYHCGFWLMVTWDETNSIMPTIMSEKPLFNCRKTGLIPQETETNFENMWQEGMKRVHFDQLLTNSKKPKNA